MSRADSTGEVTLELPVREGIFRLLMTFTGDSLLLQQRRAAGTWQTQLHLVLRPLADSLAKQYGRHINNLDLPAPLELQAARAGRLQLHLFLLSLNRAQFGQEVRYSYSAAGLLEITP